tara:strand:- start:490 stop:786 length:297 start_codon:yes stop_codon:yes gene_type:complete
MADGDFVNKNICKNGSVAPATLVAGVLPSHKCGEVSVWSTYGDVSAVDAYEGIVIIPQDTVFSFKGLTNSNQISASAGSASKRVFFRTQYYSMSLQNG